METTLTINTVADWDVAASTLLTHLSTLPRTGATIVTFSGELGAGKTTMVQAIARALGVSESVTSPTFTIMRRYELPGQVFSHLVHVDAYRIDDPAEMKVLHFDGVRQEAGTLLCVEWPEKIPSELSHVSAAVAITFVEGSESRILTIHVQN